MSLGFIFYSFIIIIIIIIIIIFVIIIIILLLLLLLFRIELLKLVSTVAVVVVVATNFTVVLFQPLVPSFYVILDFCLLLIVIVRSILCDNPIVHSSQSISRAKL